eukprot:PLAT10709.1.p1 GENE.PLAT10709.1~~PLAT10709.1.p1  ORF type:complete len:892 (+),score=384.79 PLAT10709.1:218-2677(+)
MQEYKEHVPLVRESADLLATLVYDTPGIAAAVVEAGAMEVLLEAMRLDDPGVHSQACAALAGCCSSDAAREQLAGEGGVAQITTSMDVYADDAFVQRDACAALAQLALLHDDNMQLLMSAHEAPRKVLDALTRLRDVDLYCSAISALRCIALTAEGRAEVVAEGAVDSVIDALNSFPTHATLQQEGCAALRNFCVGSDTVRDAVGAAGGISVMLEAMRGHGDVADVVSQAAGALCNLALAKDNRGIMYELNVDVALTAALRIWQGDDKPALELLHALCNLGRHPAVLTRLVEEAAFFVSLLTLPSQRIVRAVCSLLTVAASTAEACEALLETTAVAALMSLLRRSSGKPATMAAVLGVLRNIAARSDVVLADLAAADVPQLVVSRMRGAGGNVALQTAGCAMLFTLALQDGIRHLLLEMDVVPVLLDALQRPMVGQRLQAEALGALHNLSVTTEGRSAIVSADGLPAIMAVMLATADQSREAAAAKGGDQERLLRYSCAMLCTLGVESNAYRMAIASEGGVEAIIKSMQLYDDNAALLGEALAALLTMSVTPTCRKRIASMGGVPLAIAALHGNPDAPELISFATGLLVNMCMLPSVREEVLVSTALADILAAMEAHPKHTALQREACASLWVFSYEPVALNQVIEGDGVKLVLGAMTSCITDFHVQHEACEALITFSAVGDDALEKFAEYDGVTVLRETMATCTGDVVVQAKALRVLTNLCNNEDLCAAVVSSGVASSVVEAMWSCPADEQVQLLACVLIATVARIAEHRIVLKREGCVSQLREALKRFPDSSDVRDSARGALRLLGAPEDSGGAAWD